MKKKKIASFLLALAMALSLLPTVTVAFTVPEPGSDIVFDEQTGLWLDVGSDALDKLIKDGHFSNDYNPAIVVAPPEGEEPYSFQDLVIPAIGNGTDYTILQIGAGAFKDCETLETVTLAGGNNLTVMAAEERLLLRTVSIWSPSPEEETLRRFMRGLSGTAPGWSCWNYQQEL